MGVYAETKKTTSWLPPASSSGCSPTHMSSNTTVGDLGDEVKFWWTKDEGVEASRPSHCLACGVAAHGGDGRLRLHGHGSRERTVWGPMAWSERPALTSVRVRRYKCTDCGAARTVLPRGLGRLLRYSLSAIALALMAWAVWLSPAATVRGQVSPLAVRGPADADRWRSLPRWAGQSAALFGLPPSVATTPRACAARAAALVRARGPTGASEAARVLIGAHAP